MTLQRVAQLAGVSTSTVSRVVNERSNVASDTIALVQRAMRQLSFAPSPRRGGDGLIATRAAKSNAVAFLVFGTSGSHPAPAFDRLLRGVSDAASQESLDLIFSFISDSRD